MDDEREAVPCDITSSLESREQNTNIGNKCQEENMVISSDVGQEQAVNSVKGQGEVIGNMECQGQTIAKTEGQDQGQIVSNVEDKRSIVAESCNDQQDVIVSDKDLPQSTERNISSVFISEKGSVHQSESLGNEKLHQHPTSESSPPAGVCSTKPLVDNVDQGGCGLPGDSISRDDVASSIADSTKHIGGELDVMMSDIKHAELPLHSVVVMDTADQSITSGSESAASSAVTSDDHIQKTSDSYDTGDSASEAKTTFVSNEPTILETNDRSKREINVTSSAVAEDLVTAPMDESVTQTEDVHLCSSLIEDNIKESSVSRTSPDSKIAASESKPQFVDETDISVQSTPDSGLSELKNKVSDSTDAAVYKMEASGGRKVLDDKTEVSDGEKEVSDGNKQVPEGTTEVSESMTEAVDCSGDTATTDGKKQVSEGTTEVSEGMTEAVDCSGDTATTDGKKQVPEGTTEVSEGMTEAVSCAGDTATTLTGGVVCVGDAESVEEAQHKDVSQLMEYRGSSSTSPDTSSEDSDLSDNEDDSSKKKQQSQNKTPKFTAPSLEDIRTRGELFPEELPAIGELKISVDETVQMVPVGKVTSSVRVLVVIEADKELPALDEDTVLFTEDRKPFGQIFEVFGPVASPFYSVRFNSAEEIEAKGIKPGDVVYYAPKVDEFTHYVFVDKLKQIKGTDASWENNNEPPDWYKEFSDDEEEKCVSKTRKQLGDKAEEDSMDCLPGAIKPGHPSKRKQQRNNNKSGPRESKGASKRPHDHSKPLTSWPPSISDKHGYRSLPPAAPRPVRPFGQQHVYSPKPYVSPSSFKSSPQQPPAGQFQNQFPPDQPGPYRQQNSFSPRSFVSPSNFTNSNVSQKAPPFSQFPGQFPPRGCSFQRDTQGYAPPQHCPDVQMNEPRPQQQPDRFYCTDSQSQGPRFQSVQFRPPAQHPDQYSFTNPQPRPFGMNQQRPGPESMDSSYAHPPPRVDHQSMENNPHSFQTPRPFETSQQRPELGNPCLQQPRPFDMGQERSSPRFMGQGWSQGQNNPPNGPGSGNPQPPWPQSQNEYQSRDCIRNPYPYAPSDLSTHTQPPGVVDTRLAQSWTGGDSNSGRQSAFGGRPRFDAGPVTSNTHGSAQFHSSRPPYPGDNC